MVGYITPIFVGTIKPDLVVTLNDSQLYNTYIYIKIEIYLYKESKNVRKIYYHKKNSDRAGRR